ncbi:MAG: Do family serine endopeptidase [Nitrospinales bacterium]
MAQLLRTGIILLVLFAFLAVPSPAFSKETFNRRTPVVQAVKKVGPAVVNIYTEEIRRPLANPFRNFGGSIFEKFFKDLSPELNPKRRSLGSGVIIDPRGYIITNEHVIAKATRIKVTLVDQREFNAKLIGADIKSDLAIIKIDSEKAFPFIPMGRSDDLMIGETVLAIGNPFGLQHTVTMGIISALNRVIRAGEDIVFNDFIQVDASINPGNSGGPLLNINGSLIGINSAIYRKAEGIGFAIPIDHAKRVVKDLIQFGEVRRGWLGATVQDITADMVRFFHLDRPRGALVVKVFKESPAGKAGIKRGDVVLAIGNHEIQGKSDYHQTVASYTVNDRLKLKVLRDGKKRIVSARVSSIPQRYAADFTLYWLGFRVQDISRDDMIRYRLPSRKGVVVVQVNPNSPSGKTGIGPGDVIRQVNQKSIRDMKDFNKAIVEAGKRSNVLLLVQRGRNGYYVTLEP